MAKTLLHCAVALIPLLLVSSWIRSLDRWGYYRSNVPKMLHLAERADQYDALFFGSSRLYRGVIPDVFDAECARLGTPAKSFNVAAAGAGGHEVNVTIKDLFASMQSLPKHVIIELILWDPVIAEDNLMSDRVLLWHSPGEMLSILRSMALHLPRPQQLTLADKAQLGWAHVEHLVRHTFRVGRGLAIVRDMLHPRYPNPNVFGQVKQRGWKAFDLSNKGVVRRAKAFGEKSSRFAAHCKRMAEAIDDRILYELNWDAMRAQIDFLRSYGIEPIYLVAPSPGPRLSRQERQKLGEMVTLLDYSEPEVWPQFFEPEVHLDNSHLNTAGAELFSRQIARDYLRVCSQQRGK